MLNLIIYLQSNWLFITNSTIDDESFNTTQKLDYSSWNYVVVLITNGDVMISVNGSQLLNTISNFDSPGSVETVTLGGSFDDITNHSFNGLMQDIGVFSRLLTSTELSFLANGGKSLSRADFLPQCICPPDSFTDTTDSLFCDNGVTRLVVINRLLSVQILYWDIAMIIMTILLPVYVLV